MTKKGEIMAVISAKALLEAGAHFGHRTGKWNPKMKPYVLGKRNKIHIINLRETVRGVAAAYFYVRRVSAQGKQVLFVGTKRQARDLVLQSAQDCNMPYVIERWLGGSLTNLQTIRLRVQRLIELEKIFDDGTINSYSKKMISALSREKRKITRNLQGIRTMNSLPGAVIVVDPTIEGNAIHEASRLGIPIIAILDTDADPDAIDIPIPANDDSVRAIELILGRIAAGVKEGRIEAGHRVEFDQKTNEREPAQGASEANARRGKVAAAEK